MPAKSRTRKKDYISVTVPFGANRAEEPERATRQAIVSWANRQVWTDRMLDALTVGVQGGKWHALIDKVYRELNLDTAARRVVGKRGSAGVDRQSTEDFEEHLLIEVKQLSEQLPLGIPTVRDRVVQTALVHVIEPILDHTFHDRSFGFRHGRSCHDALFVVEELLESGHVYVVDADLKGYFDTIPKDRLLALVGESISDRRVLALIELFLNQSVMEELSEWTPEAGVPRKGQFSRLQRYCKQVRFHG